MALLDLPESELRARTSLKWRAFPPDVLPLWVAEMDVRPHHAVREALERALRLGDTGYPWGNAMAEAYAGLAETRWNWRPAPEQVRRSGDVMNTMLAFLMASTDQGDHIVVNPPIYPPFRAIVEGYHRQLTEVHLTAEGRLDLEAIETALEGPDRPTAYLLCSPHNPTGTLHATQELAALTTLCADRNVQLIVDEIHAPLVDPGAEFVPILSLPEGQRAVVAFSAGKGWNLAGFKGGVMVRGSDAGAVFDRMPPLSHQSTGQFATLAHTAALTHAQGWVDDLMVEVAHNKDLLEELLARWVPEVRFRRGPATYLGWLDCSALGLDNPQRTFLERGKVAFNPGQDFGAEYGQYVRINLATSPALIEEAVRRISSSLGRVEL